MDGASQVGHTAALAVRIASWLRDEEARAARAIVRFMPEGTTPKYSNANDQMRSDLVSIAK